MDNPYNRFSTISNVGSALIILGSVAAVGMPAYNNIFVLSGGAGVGMAAAAGVIALVTCWIALNEAIFPMLFRINAVRRIILGKYYLEGTWLQAERGETSRRMAVIDIQPNGKSFIFSGYALNKNLETEANTLIELSKFEWPFMTYKYRNSLSDGSDGHREGIGELQFEMNRESARRYNGFLQYVKAEERVRIEGAKLVKNTEVKQLRTLEGRHDVFEKYWTLFFDRQVKPGTAKHAARLDEIRKGREEQIIRRRRSSDWDAQNAKPADEQPDLEERESANS